MNALTRERVPSECEAGEGIARCPESPLPASRLSALRHPLPQAGEGKRPLAPPVPNPNKTPSSARTRRSPAAAARRIAAPCPPTSRRTRPRPSGPGRAACRGGSRRGACRRRRCARRDCLRRIGPDAACCRPSRGLMWPFSDGQPTHSPATGITRCGSFSMSLTLLRMIADHADRAGAEPDRVGGGEKRRQHDAGIDRGIEELVEMVVGKRLAAHVRNFRQPPSARQENEKRGRGADERLIRDQIGDNVLLGLFQDDDVGLLEVALRRRRQRAGAKQAQQGGVHRLVEIAAMHLAAGDAGERVEAGKVVVDRECSPKRCCRAAVMAFADSVSGMSLLRLCAAISPRHGRLVPAIGAPLIVAT